MRQKILDLTKPLNHCTKIYSKSGYTDPPFEHKEWCTIEQQGYSVYSISLGSQTGTHIDAPAHFDKAGATLGELALDNLIGSYFLIDLPVTPEDQSTFRLLSRYANELMLFIRAAKSSPTVISYKTFEIMLSLPPKVWVLSGEIEIEAAPTFEFHRLLAKSGKYLVEDLNTDSAELVNGGGELIIMPLALEQVSGSPCRVVLRTF